MKKKIGYTLLVFLVIIIALSFIGVQRFNNAFFKEKPNYLEYTSESKPIHFDWVVNSTDSTNYHDPQAAMIIPLKIEKIPHNFYMQFDTGSPYSFIYENDLNSLREIGLDIKEVIKNETHYVEHLDIMLDDNHIEVSMIKILENYGHNFNKNDTINQIGIGTIGSDFIVNRITSIDFKNQNIHFFNDRTQLMKKLPAFKPFSFTGRRIMLPAIIDDKEYEFIYDSGCSAFGLITIKNRFERYSDENTEEVTYNAKSWNDKIPIKSKLTDKPFNIGNADLTLKRVSYVDMYTAMQPIITPFTRVGGWLGNQPFNESILILDTKTEEFIITKE